MGRGLVCWGVGAGGGVGGGGGGMGGAGKDAPQPESLFSELPRKQNKQKQMENNIAC